jgi:hypothetical protein
MMGDQLWPELTGPSMMAPGMVPLDSEAVSWKSQSAYVAEGTSTVIAGSTRSAEGESRWPDLHSPLLIILPDQFASALVATSPIALVRAAPGDYVVTGLSSFNITPDMWPLDGAATTMKNGSIYANSTQRAIDGRNSID